MQNPLVSTVGLMMLLTFFLAIFAGTQATDIGYRPGDRDRCNRSVDIYHAVSSPNVTEQNIGRPLHCSYRIRLRPARNDWIVFIRFTKLRVGKPSGNRRHCHEGYLQIVDGYKENNTQTNKDSPGFYCGELDSPKMFISETPDVKIVFHVDSYDHESYLQFDASVETQQGVPKRYGPYPHLYPHRRGVLVPGTYCERNFQDCNAPGRCFVQSPGFPGIYPRNLHCRYRITVPQGLAGLTLISFDVDGLRCDNLLLCFPRSVTRDPEDCPYDYVRVYDGLTEESPRIVTLCGRGGLKSNVVASGSRMLVEFVTSPTGPLLNFGFDFKAENMFDATESQPLRLRNGTCVIENHLHRTVSGPSGALSGGSSVYSNLRSWYPANTTCQYRFFAGEGEIIRLEFISFRILRPTLCREWLKIYDSYDPNPTKIITMLCDTSKPRTEPPRSIFESAGNVLLVRFFSNTGSLDGSSINYGFEVKSVSVASPVPANHAAEHLCSQVFRSEESLSGSFSFPIGQLNYSSPHAKASAPGPHHHRTILCNATFDAQSLTHGRVALTIQTPNRCDACRENGNSHLQVHLGGGNNWSWCLCQPAETKTHNLVSLDPQAMMNLHIAGQSEAVKQLPAGRGLVHGTYTFYTDFRCGPSRFDLGLQGVFSFPFFTTTLQGYCNDEPCSVNQGPAPQTGPLKCVWKVPVYQDMDLVFRLENYSKEWDCENTPYILKVGGTILCPPKGRRQTEIIIHRDELGPEITIDFAAPDMTGVNFTLWWTLMNVLPGSSESEPYVSLDKDCEFLCATALVCLKKELVCNGVLNCPGPSGADEDAKVCANGMDGFKFYWWIVGAGIAVCTGVALCITFSICKLYNTGTRRFK